MTTLKHDLVNELAIQTINAPDAETKEMYYTMLFEEIKTWVSLRVDRYFSKLKGYGATKEDITGHFHDSIQKVIEGKAFAEYDPAKGDFAGIVDAQARNPLKDYADYLKADRRAVVHEGVSLDEQSNADEDNTIGDVIPSKEADVADNVVDSMYTTNLLDEFARSSKRNGESKAKVILFLMYPEQYDTQHIAEALGHDQYDSLARKKVERIRKEFREFMSQRQ